MATTKITDEQLRFISDQTGEHILGDYLEDAEKGGRTLGDLLSDLFDDQTGNVHANLIQWRVNPTTRAIQTRVGQYVDPNAGWMDTGDYYYRHRGNWSPSTAYKQTDTVIYDGMVYFAAESHTSDPTFVIGHWVPILSAAAFAAISQPILDAAQQSADDAQDSADAAAQSAQDAQDLIDALNMPTPVADTYLRRNSSNTGYEAVSARDIAQEVADVQPLPATSGTVTLDLSTGCNFAGTLTGDITLATPSNLEPGQSFVVVITNDSTPREISYSAAYNFPNGSVPGLTQEAGAVDILVGYVESLTRISAVLHRGMSQ